MFLIDIFKDQRKTLFFQQKVTVNQKSLIKGKPGVTLAITLASVFSALFGKHIRSPYIVVKIKVVDHSVICSVNICFEGLLAFARGLKAWWPLLSED